MNRELNPKEVRLGLVKDITSGNGNLLLLLCKIKTHFLESTIMGEVNYASWTFAFSGYILGASKSARQYAKCLSE